MLPGGLFLMSICLVLSAFAALGGARPINSVSLYSARGVEQRVQCQAPKTGPGDPLSGCPKGTVFVSQRHPAAKFKSINDALNALPEDGRVGTVLIDSGSYNEKVVVTRLSPTVLLGVTAQPRDAEKNQVQVWQSSYVNQSDPTSLLHNCDAVVLGVGNGGPVGNPDFKAYNIDFAQRQFLDGKEVTDYQLGPAAALCVQNSNASFYGCGFSSYQDTIFVGSGSEAFFFQSIVKGMTDQLYGSGKAWFEKVKLLSRACGGGITAWRGDPANPDVGVYVSNSVIDRSPDASNARPMQKRCHLGRPWNIYSHSVFLNTRMSDIVADAGFKTWSTKAPNFDPKLTRFAEYGSSGPGGNLKTRDTKVQSILTNADARNITYRKIFGDSIPWIDSRTVKDW